MEPQAAGRTTFLLVDGENLDATLGTDILRHRPAPDERPRWDRVTEFLRQAWGQDVRGLFFLNASSGTMPMPFVQALLALGYRVDPAVGRQGREGRRHRHPAHPRGPGRPGRGRRPRQPRRRLRGGAAAAAGTRRVALLGFREYVSQRLAELEPLGLQFFDMELAVGAFNIPLPRVRIITLDEFDPEHFLS